MAITPKEVKKRALLYEMEDHFWSLVKRGVVPFAAVLTVVGAGGIWIAVELIVQRVAETPLRELQKEVVRAEVQADAAKRASDAAKTSSEQVTAGLNTLNTTLQGLTEQAKAVELQFRLVTDQINAASDNARLRSQRDFDAVQRRIAALEALVKQIGEESAASRKATAEYARQIAALESKVEREQKRFAENSEYTVLIFFDPSRKALATELQSRLAALGFRAPVHELPAKAFKGNALTYHEQSDAKAQEVLALLKPVVKDVQGKKAKPPEIFSKLTEVVPSKGADSFKSGGFTYHLLAWNLDAKSMQLALGVN